MSEILTLHGAVPGVDRERIRFQNMADRDVLDAFLRRAPRFVPLAEALAGHGDALTIDDATVAAADAARLALAHGHAVSLFVNPGQVVSGEPYWFSLLHELMDRLEGPACEYEGVRYPIATRRDRRALREPIRVRCRGLREEADRIAVIQELAVRWLGDAVELPPFLSTLGQGDLVALRDAGVDLQNHGWTHVDHEWLTADESRAEIEAGREWLMRELGVDAPCFAVPFGDVMPREFPTGACRTWLTLYWDRPAGELQPGVVNRTERAFVATAPQARSWWSRWRRLFGMR